MAQGRSGRHALRPCVPARWQVHRDSDAALGRSADPGRSDHHRSGGEHRPDGAVHGGTAAARRRRILHPGRRRVLTGSASEAGRVGCSHRARQALDPRHAVAHRSGASAVRVRGLVLSQTRRGSAGCRLQPLAHQGTDLRSHAYGLRTGTHPGRLEQEHRGRRSAPRAARRALVELRRRPREPTARPSPSTPASRSSLAVRP